MQQPVSVLKLPKEAPTIRHLFADHEENSKSRSLELYSANCNYANYWMSGVVSGEATVGKLVKSALMSDETLHVDTNKQAIKCQKSYNAYNPSTNISSVYFEEERKYWIFYMLPEDIPIPHVFEFKPRSDEPFSTAKFQELEFSKKEIPELAGKGRLFNFAVARLGSSLYFLANYASAMEWLKLDLNTMKFTVIEAEEGAMGYGTFSFSIQASVVNPSLIHVFFILPHAPFFHYSRMDVKTNKWSMHTKQLIKPSNLEFTSCRIAEDKILISSTSGMFLFRTTGRMKSEVESSLLDVPLHEDELFLSVSTQIGAASLGVTTMTMRHSADDYLYAAPLYTSSQKELFKIDISSLKSLWNREMSEHQMHISELQKLLMLPSTMQPDVHIRSCEQRSFMTHKLVVRARLPWLLDFYSSSSRTIDLSSQEWATDTAVQALLTFMHTRTLNSTIQGTPVCEYLDPRESAVVKDNITLATLPASSMAVDVEKKPKNIESWLKYASFCLLTRRLDIARTVISKLASLNSPKIYAQVSLLSILLKDLEQDVEGAVQELQTLLSTCGPLPGINQYTEYLKRKHIQLQVLALGDPTLEFRKSSAEERLKFAEMPNSALESSFLKLYNSEDGDIRIRFSSGREVKLHSFFVIAVSSFLEELLNMKNDDDEEQNSDEDVEDEDETGEQGKQIFKLDICMNDWIEDVDEEMMEVCFKYFYTHHVNLEHLSIEQVVKLLSYAQFLQIGSLNTLAERHLMMLVPRDNVVVLLQLLEAAFRYGCQELLEMTTDVCVNKISIVIETGYFQDTLSVDLKFKLLSFSKVKGTLETKQADMLIEKCLNVSLGSNSGKKHKKKQNQKQKQKPKSTKGSTTNPSQPAKIQTATTVETPLKPVIESNVVLGISDCAIRLSPSSAIILTPPIPRTTGTCYTRLTSTNGSFVLLSLALKTKGTVSNDVHYGKSLFRLFFTTDNVRESPTPMDIIRPPYDLRALGPAESTSIDGWSEHNMEFMITGREIYTVANGSPYHRKWCHIPEIVDGGLLGIQSTNDQDRELLITKFNVSTMDPKQAEEWKEKHAKK